jgi:TRAP-type transport system periplasmic protein
MSTRNARRATVVTSVVALTALVVGACGSQPGAGGESGGETTLVLGHAGSETDPRQQASEQLKELIESESDGRITVEIHANSTLGTWEEMVEGLQMGTTDIVIESLLSLEAYSDLASIETAPFLYDSPEQFFEVWDGEIGEEILSTISEETGYAVLGNMYRGPRHLTTKEPVTSISDLQGMTVRTPSAPTMVQTWQQLGARAEALPWSEVYSALEQGVIDGQENPLDVAVFNAIYEVAPEVTTTAHMYANYHFLMWEDSLAGMPEDDQQIIRDATEQVAQDYTANTAESQEEYTAELEEKGATFHELTDRDAWVEATQPVVDGLPDQVQEWIAEIRG